MPNLNSPILSLGSGSVPPGSDPAGALPPWMKTKNGTMNTNNNSIGSSTTPSPSVSLTLYPSEPVVLDPVHSDNSRLPRFLPVQLVGTVAQCCKETEAAKENWAQHRKEAAWRLSRVEQQLEAEKGRKRKETTEEIEAKIRCVREEETAALRRLEAEYREKLSELRRDAEGKEGKLMEVWSNKQMKLSRVVEEINGGLSQSQRMNSAPNYHHGMG